MLEILLILKFTFINYKIVVHFVLLSILVNVRLYR